MSHHALERHHVASLAGALAVSALMLTANPQHWWAADVAYIVPATLASGIDLATHRIPTRLVYPASALLTSVIALTSVLTSHPETLLVSVLAGAATMAGWYLFALLTGGLGMGDVRLALLCGLYAGTRGWDAVALSPVLAIFIGGVAAIVFKLIWPARTHLPYGPSLALGALIAAVVMDMT